MAAHIAPRGSDDTCCECSEWNDCECGAGACALTCESKAYTAQLCGHAELTTPSSPPKRYKRKTTTGVMTRTRYNTTDCEALLYAEKTEQVGGAGPGTYLKVYFERVGDLVVKVTFECRWAPGGPYSYGCNVGDIVMPAMWSGATYDEVIYVTVDASYSGNTIGVVWGSNLVADLDYGEVTEDTWDITEDYAPGLAEDPPECTPTLTDDSVRRIEGAPVSGPFGDIPPDVYTANADVTTTNTQRRTEGDEECVGPVAFLYSKLEGEVIENLSQEDTEDDAEDRATADLEWSACTGLCVCSALSAFRSLRGAGEVEFTGRRVRVKANGSELVPESTYTVKIRWFRRVLGSSGPYLFYAEHVGAVATGPAETTKSTDWVDVPNEAGWETVAGNCSFILVP